MAAMARFRMTLCGYPTSLHCPRLPGTEEVPAVCGKRYLELQDPGKSLHVDSVMHHTLEKGYGL